MPKGTYGYLAKKRKTELIRTILLFAVAFGIYLAGYFSTGTQQNLFTIIAVLGMLPACQRAVICFLSFKAKGTDSEDYERLNPVLEQLGLSGLYDLFLTGERKNFPVGLACLSGDTLFLLCREGDGLRDHLSPFLAQEGLDEIKLTILAESEALAGALEKNAEGQETESGTKPEGTAEMPAMENRSEAMTNRTAAENAQQNEPDEPLQGDALRDRLYALLKAISL